MMPGMKNFGGRSGRMSFEVMNLGFFCLKTSANIGGGVWHRWHENYDVNCFSSYFKKQSWESNGGGVVLLKAGLVRWLSWKGTITDQVYKELLSKKYLLKALIMSTPS